MAEMTVEQAQAFINDVCMNGIEYWDTAGIVKTVRLSGKFEKNMLAIAALIDTLTTAKAEAEARAIEIDKMLKMKQDDWIRACRETDQAEASAAQMRGALENIIECASYSEHEMTCFAKAQAARLALTTPAPTLAKLEAVAEAAELLETCDCLSFGGLCCDCDRDMPSHPAYKICGRDNLGEVKRRFIAALAALKGARV